jgi:HEAT repeat protein
MADPGMALKTWIQKLKAPEPAEREAGIRGLEMLGDTDALPALSEVFATDPDPDLRALAQEAAKTIYYGAIRRTLETRDSASEDERRLAAEILARAQAKKLQDKR